MAIENRSFLIKRPNMSSKFSPTAASLLPFVIWCFLCDIPVTVSYVYFVLKGDLRISKAFVICCPLMMSILAKVIAAVLIAAGSDLAFLTACGESWGWAFMCLAFLEAGSGIWQKDYDGHGAEAAGIQNITFLQGDVGALPFEDGTFDVVLSLNGFHAFPDKEAAYRETFRVLKKEGTFCGCFYVRGGCKSKGYVGGRHRLSLAVRERRCV